MTQLLHEQINELQAKLNNATETISDYRNRDNLAQQVANIGYWDFIPSTGALIWSPEVRPLMTGTAGNEIETSYDNFLKYIYPDDRQQCDDIISTAIKNNIPFKVEYRVQHFDNSIRWLYGWGGPIDRQDDIQRMVGAVMDITDRKSMEEALNLQNKKLQKSLEEIKTLKGIIPICSYCHDIRDTKGKWSSVAAYISNHSNARLSHGVCPSCTPKVRLLSGLDQFKK
ncbi:MAG: hypothetical protein COC19_04765 [SAR86 cluster bacterium]|uniref:histidine kinase n=1 Tax=SAR86 cluster bacterium TaxID=2030880 RepID=A0A2A4MNW9_9GAMM|nr:MAG: hypothetical protein COC19_04765 [SAR86 cluster bacterium]